MSATVHQPLWGVDLGGTKIEGAIIDAHQPDRAIARERLATESDRGYDHIVGRVRTVVEQLEATSGLSRPQTVGIGTPGAVVISLRNEGVEGILACVSACPTDDSGVAAEADCLRRCGLPISAEVLFNCIQDFANAALPAPVVRSTACGCCLSHSAPSASVSCAAT